MTVDTVLLDDLADDDDYPHVVGADNAAGYALDHAYAVIDEEIDDDNLLESLALLPAQYVRGTPTSSDARMILNDISEAIGTNEAVSEAVEEAKVLL